MEKDRDELSAKDIPNWKLREMRRVYSQNPGNFSMRNVRPMPITPSEIRMFYPEPVPDISELEDEDNKFTQLLGLIEKIIRILS